MSFSLFNKTHIGDIMKKPNFKKVAAVAGAVGIVAGTILGAVAFPVEKPVVVENTVVKQVEVPVPFVVEKNVTQVVEVEKLVEVPVDNGDMDFVLCRLEDKDIIEDCDEIVAELKAEDAALDMAFAYVDDNREELFDMLEDEGLVGDEDDVEIVKVYNDFEDVEVIEADFDDEEYEFKLLYKVEDTDEEEKFKIEVTVKVEDGEVKIVSVDEQ